MVSLLILQRTRTESGWLPWTTLVMQMMRGSWLDVFGEEDNQDFWFMDSKLSPPPSPTSSFDFIDSSNLFDNTGDLSDGYKSMMDLEDVPSLKSFSKVLKMRTTYMAIIRSQKCLKNQQMSRRGMIQCPNSYRTTTT